MYQGPDLPNCYYRVSVRALITNEAGDILMVNEAGRGWTSPGGGLDWGENPIEGLRRELMEELGCDGDISPLPVLITSWTHEEYRQNMLWLMYRVDLDTSKIQSSPDIEEHRFMTLDEHISSETRTEGGWVCSTDYAEDLKKVLASS